MLKQETLKALVKGKSKEEILGEGGVLKSLIKSLVEAAMGAEMDHHLGYAKTKVQLCIVHMVRNSLRYVSWKDKKKVAADLKLIYRSATIEDAELELISFS